ncbi:hypothetical protein [Jiangella mangrovi]|uniref:Uncharacterized protein n=1 Tax=Jiangella mangrovi TaxID=1524084 RepID=A0A7W9GSU0_9ACTN|nr:hypothetical protein [Jiangella mangrovi]MBB5789407.1 hypothetical protein [Jiangella mangrovi]
MGDLVTLYYRRNRGWPTPEDSYGLTPMYGADGWCRGCGVSLREQTGSIVLRSKGLTGAQGAWIPYWRTNVLCMQRSLGEDLAGRFGLRLRPVVWPRQAPGEAVQVLMPVVGERWFDPDELRRRTHLRHGRDGVACPTCGTWRWLPLRLVEQPPVHVGPELAAAPIAASPEWFGDGWSSFHKLLMVRELAELIQRASPRDFTVEEVPQVYESHP